MSRRLQQGLLWLGASFSLLLSLFGGVLVFLLFTSAGAQLAFAVTARASNGMVSAEGVAGRLWGPLTVEHLRVSVEAVDIDIDQLRLSAALPLLLAARIDASTLQAQQVKVTLKPHPDTPDDTPPLTRLPFALRVREGQVQAVRVVLESGEVLAFDDIELDGSWVGPRVRVRHAAVTTPWVGRVQLKGRAELLEEGIDFSPTQLQGFLQGTLQGHFGYNRPSDLRLSWQRIQWPPASEDAGGKSEELSSGGGQAHWHGLLDDYRYELSGALQLPKLPLQLKASGAGSLSDLRVEQLQARGLGGSLQAQLQIDWREALRIDGEGSFRDIDPEALVPELAARLNGRFSAQTRIVDAKPQVDFEARLQDSRWRDHVLNLQTNGRYADERLQLDALQLSSGSLQLSGSGQVLPSLDARAKLSAGNLADAWPGLSGSLQLDAQAQGALTRPHLQASGQAQQLRYQDYALASAQLSADVDLDRQLDVELKLKELKAGTTLEQLHLALHGPLAAHSIVLELQGEPGAVQLKAQGAFDPAQTRWQGQLLSGRIAPQRFAAWNLEQAVSLALSPRSTQFEAMCWSAERGRACFGLKQNGALRRFDFGISEFALAYLQPILPGGAQIDVVLHGSGFVELGPKGLQDLRAEIATSGGRWQLGGLPPIELKPAHLLIDDDESGTHLDLSLPFAGGGISGQARLGSGTQFMERALDGHLHAELPDLSWLRQVNVEIAEASGRLIGDLNLAGTLAQPQPRGQVNLEDGKLRLVTPGIQLSEMRAQLDADGEQAMQLSASANSGKGSLKLAGQINPWVDPLSLDLKLSGENFQAMNTREARVQISPDLRITLAQRLLDVSGSIEVPKAEITPKSLGDGSVSASNDQVLVGDDPGAQQQRELRISADVTLRLGEDVQFNGFGLKTQLKGAVQAIERPGVATRARGEINLDGGHYKAYGQDLSIETGRLIFSGPVTEPALDLRATRKPTDEITVGLLVRGDLRKPQFQLFSTPGMPQDQQLGWLVLGRSINETTSAADKAAVGGAATSLGLAGGAWLAQQLGSKVGIDEVSVGAKPGQTQDQAMFTVGKYLSPKLFIAYGMGLFQPGHIFRMQYSIGHGFKLQSETGVESGGDLLYTIERK